MVDFESHATAVVAILVGIVSIIISLVSFVAFMIRNSNRIDTLILRADDLIKRVQYIEQHVTDYVTKEEFKEVKIVVVQSATLLTRLDERMRIRTRIRDLSVGSDPVDP